MDNCWSILGIEPTSDKRTIKLAYAKQLKITRPDQDAAGFTRLHDAYQEAQWLAENDWFEAVDERISSDIQINPDGSGCTISLDAMNAVMADSKPAPFQNNEQKTINDVLTMPVDLSYLRGNSVAVSKPIEIADDASAFLDNVLLPNEWLSQISNLLLHREALTIESQATLTEKWLSLIQQGEHFDEAICAHASNLILHPIYEWKQNQWQPEWDEVNRQFWYEFNDAFESKGWSRKLFYQFSKSLKWWDNVHYVTWRADFDEDFVDKLAFGTTNTEQHDLWQKQNKKLRQQNYWRLIPEKQHSGQIIYASFKRRLAAKMCDVALILLTFRLCAIALQNTLGSTSLFKEFPQDTWLFITAFLFTCIYLGAEASSSRGFIGSRLAGIKLINWSDEHLNVSQVVRYFALWTIPVAIIFLGVYLRPLIGSNFIFIVAIPLSFIAYTKMGERFLTYIFTRFFKNLKAFVIHR